MRPFYKFLILQKFYFAKVSLNKNFLFYSVPIRHYPGKDTWDAIHKFPLPNTLHRIFTNYLDIESPPSRKLLGYFALCAGDEEEKAKLHELATVSSRFFSSFLEKRIMINVQEIPVSSERKVDPT